MKLKPLSVLFGVLTLVAVVTIDQPSFGQESFPNDAQVTISNGASTTHGTCSATSCFDPNVMNINTGNTVTWYNADTVGHTVTSGRSTDNQSGTIFDSSLIKTGGTYSFTFQNAGYYNYFCQVHPWMTGEIIVGVQQTLPVPQVTVTTDKSTYVSGEIVTLSGHVTNPYQDQTVAIKATNPSGNVVFVSKSTLDNNGDFVTTINTASPLMAEDGQYTVYAQQGYGATVAQVQFTLTGIPSTTQTQPPSSQGNVQVTISNGASNTNGKCDPTNCFNPQVVNVNVGDTVTWTNADIVSHTATYYDGNMSDTSVGTVWDSSMIKVGGTYTTPTFTKAGIYPYFCQVHPWMTGEVIVGGSGIQTPLAASMLVSTDKSVYNGGDLVTISIHLQNAQNSQTVAILVTDPSGNVLASRTITYSQYSNTLQIGLPQDVSSGTYKVTATASVYGSTETASAMFTVASSSSPISQVTILSVQPTNQQGTPVPSFGKGATGYAKVVLSSQSIQTALITINLVGADSTSLGVGIIKLPLNSGQTEIQVSFFIPSSASSGTATIYADVFSDWPTNGGTPLTGERSSAVGIG